MLATCPVCKNHEAGCTCVERTTPDCTASEATQREWVREGFRFVHFRPSFANEDTLYCVYRMRADLYPPAEVE